jgi:hypothetical protein
MSEQFERENRYIVIKRSDLKKVPVSYRSSLVDPMFSLLSHLPRRKFLVIESDWPEYEQYWQRIELRVNDATGAQPEVVAVINEEGTIFKETVVEHRPGIERLPVGTELVDIAHVIRLTAERDALQQRLNAADQRNDELARDKARLDALESNFWDVRFDSSPNGDAGNSTVSIEIVGHWMDKPFERVIGENYSENLRAAIDQAMTAPAFPPERPEYPEPTSDDDWHMNPCKQGHRDVGAAGGVAHCYTCDEKIEAATTQEAFERWNATHPAAQP